MDRLEKIYEEFGVMMNEDRIYEDETVSYEDICRGLGVASAAGSAWIRPSSTGFSCASWATPEGS